MFVDLLFSSAVGHVPYTVADMCVGCLESHAWRTQIAHSLYLQVHAIRDIVVVQQCELVLKHDG